MSETTPYQKTSPGDLITADLFNGVQVDTRDEIAKTRSDLLEEIKKATVARAGDADKLGGKTPDEWAEYIVNRALQAVPRLTNYRVVYKRLQSGEPALIKHGLKSYPLVDVYQLGDFPVVASADEMQTVQQVSWFLYHRTEMKIRRPKDPPAPANAPPLITIEESRGPVFKHKFQDMLDLYQVKYTEQSTLGDVVNEFWKKIFSDPNDPFDETTYANSPWFDRCCGDRRTVESLRRGGEWDDLYLMVKPRKTVNAIDNVVPLPVLVEHFDLETVGLTWTRGAPVVRIITDASGQVQTAALGDAVEDDEPDELRVMVLLKV